MSTLSSYDLLEQIAQSPQAVVYKAYRRNNPQRWLVLKTLPASRLSEYRKAQIRQKIEHLQVLSDPLLMLPISFGDQDNMCFITQDFFDGVPLDRLLAEYGRIPLPHFFSIACDLARALDKAHEAGIIHGGVKPHNILVNPRSSRSG